MPDSVPQPIMEIVSPAPAPQGHWIKRAAVALFVERRLPYRLAQPFDKIVATLGWRHKIVKANGLRLKIHRMTADERIVWNIIVNREYTPPGFEVRETDTVIDIGANIGIFSLMAARAASRGRVVAFEPSGQNHHLFLRNIQLNRASNVVPVHAAVGAGPGEIKLFLSEASLHSVVADRMVSPDRFEVVRSVGLKDVFDQHGIERCHFLKLDCEGAEYDILYNLPPDYFGRVDRIVMEFHGVADPAARRAESDRLVAHLQRMGFAIAAYVEFPPPFRGGWIRAIRRGLAGAV